MQQCLVLVVTLCVEQCQSPVILMAARSGRGLWDGTKLIACTPLRGCSFFVEEMCSIILLLLACLGFSFFAFAGLCLLSQRQKQLAKVS